MMSDNLWGSVKSSLSAIAPVLANAVLPGSGGLAKELVSSVLDCPVDDPAGMAAAISQASPEQKAALIAEQNRHLEELSRETNRHLEALETAAGGQMAAVNQTMQVEYQTSAALSAFQKGWRPMCGYALAAGVFGSVMFVCYLFYSALHMGVDGPSISQIVSVLPGLGLSIAAILTPAGAAVGITAWQRGEAQKIQASSDLGGPVMDGIIGITRVAKK